MSKAGDIAKISAKGTFHYIWGLVLSSIITAVGAIFIARLLGSDLYGLYTIVLAVPSLILIFRDWGIRQAMIRFTAQYRAEGRLEEVRSVFVSGLIFEITLSLVLAVITFLLSDFLATSIFNRPTITPLIQITSIHILASGLLSAASAAFTGIEKMSLNSIMIVCQSFFRTLLIIALVIVGLSLSGAILGLAISTVIAGLVGITFMGAIYRELPKPITLKLEMLEYIKEMLKYGVPLSTATIILGFLTQFYVFLLPIHYVIDNTMIGNFGIAQNFIVLIGFFATPITTMLFPAFSKLDYRKDLAALQNVYQSSIKYAALLVVPVSMLVMSLSEPAVTTLFGVTYEAAPLFLALLSISYLYTAFGNLSNGNLINSQGQTKFYLKTTLLTAAIGFPVGFILILQFGVLGLLATMLTASLPSLIVSLYWIKKQYGLNVDWVSSSKILFSSILTAFLTYLIVTQLTFESWIRLLLGVIIFILILIPSMLFTRAITRSDLSNLNFIAGDLGILSGIIKKILGLIERIMTILKL